MSALSVVTPLNVLLKVYLLNAFSAKCFSIKLIRRMIYTRGKQKLELIFQVYCHFRFLFLKTQYHILKARDILYKTVYLYFSCD